VCECGSGTDYTDTVVIAGAIYVAGFEVLGAVGNFVDSVFSGLRLWWNGKPPAKPAPTPTAPAPQTPPTPTPPAGNAPGNTPTIDPPANTPAPGDTTTPTPGGATDAQWDWNKPGSTPSGGGGPGTIIYEPATPRSGISAADAKTMIAQNDWGPQAADGSYTISTQMPDGRYLEIAFRALRNGAIRVFHAMPF